MPSPIPNDIKTAIDAITGEIEPRLIELRRDIHAHPELAFEEVRTAGVVADELAKLGIEHKTGIGKTGVVGYIKGGKPGPTLLIRADMDALPIHEDTGLPFASTVPGKMHACGHDIHTTTLIGVGAVLQKLAPNLSGNIKLMFQPAEEAMGGAAAMIADGVMEGVDMALGMHNRPEIPAGRFGIVRGPTTASTDLFEILLEGKGGHSARPFLAKDPIVAASQLITQISTIVSNDINAFHACAIAVGAIHAGKAHNVIPDTCEIKGTVRSREPEARKAAEEALRRLVAGIEVSTGVKCHLTYKHGVPALVNDDRILNPTVKAIQDQIGDVADEWAASMGGEDFSLVSERVPSFRLLIGSAQPGRADKVHTPTYQPSEDAIGYGVRALARAAADLLS